MLSCRDVGRLTSDYLNRDLPWRRRLAIRAHLLMCEGCTRYVAQMRATLQLLRSMGQDASPQDAPVADHARARDWFRNGRS